MLQHILSSLKNKESTLRNSPYYKIFVAIILFGIALKIYQYASFRSLWGDEAMLSRNITEKPLGELITQPLDYNQGAPILFLFIEKVFTLLFGNTDFILRLFPFLCGVALNVILPCFAVKNFGRGAGFAAAVLTSLNIKLLYYSSEVKQYGVDALVCLSIFLLFYQIFKHGIKKRCYWQLIVAGIISAMLSHPAIYFLGGCGAVLWLHTFWHERKQKEYRQIYHLAFIFFIWGMLYLVLYFVTLKNLAENSYLVNYWKFAFIPNPPWTNLQWLYSLPYDLYSGFMYMAPYHWVIILCSLIGLVYLWKKNRWILACVFIVLTGMIIASMLQIYPIKERMITFVIPFMILSVSTGVELITMRFNEWKTLSNISIVLTTLIMALGSLNYIGALIKNPDLRYREHIKPLLEIIWSQKEPAEPLYVFYTAGQSYMYYSNQKMIEVEYVVYGENHDLNTDEYIKELLPLMKESSIWLLFTRDEIDGINHKSYILAYCDQYGTRLEEYFEPGAALYRYEFH